MSIEQAKQIIAEKDISTKEKRELFLEAVKTLSGNGLKRQN